MWLGPTGTETPSCMVSDTCHFEVRSTACTRLGRMKADRWARIRSEPASLSSIAAMVIRSM